MTRRLVVSRLEKLTGGQLSLREAGTVTLLGQPHSNGSDGLCADLEVLDPRFWSKLLTGGSLGAAEAYLDGWWESRDLTSLVRLMARDRSVTGRLESGLARIGHFAAQAWHAVRPNSRRGSRKNIEAHYDLGNDLFALFLDRSMTYSAALFERPDASLDEAQEAKIDRLCRKLQLTAGDHLLEIGTGWGSLAIHAAGRYGCRVTTTTISPSQYAEASRRVAEAGLADRVSILQKDYRDLTGSFSKIVSVEMIEAVGHQFLNTFYATLDRLLRPDGLAALQAITIADRNYEAARKDVDFIQRYIFPGGAIHSLTALTAAATKASRLTLLHVEDLGLHYAETLRCWRERFDAARDRVRALGYPERFIRLWRYYFCYCEGGFRERVIGDAQMLFAGPEFRGRTVLGTLEASLS
jgi:cyclopropane-fatty-acyl-phospholipid synthase